MRCSKTKKKPRKKGEGQDKKKIMEEEKEEWNDVRKKTEAGGRG